MNKASSLILPLRYRRRQLQSFRHSDKPSTIRNNMDGEKELETLLQTLTPRLHDNLYVFCRIVGDNMEITLKPNRLPLLWNPKV
nr:ACT domain-containing protein [Desulfomarina profundi]